MKKAIAEFVLYKIMGWQLIGKLPDLKKYIILGGPHTSNWDFLLAMSTVWITEAPVNVIAKKELFKFPLGFIMRSLRVMPIERKKSQNQVDAIVEMYNARERFIVALAPEGTRKKVDRLKSGFYHIAIKANLPVVTISVDAKNKQLIIQEPYYNTGDIETDFKYFNNMFKMYTGLIPENSF
jgi:1-acyl-sn-glycerol-3-phosphate acyltransferase